MLLVPVEIQEVTQRAIAKMSCRAWLFGFIV